jgi:hypothetical protein
LTLLKSAAAWESREKPKTRSHSRWNYKLPLKNSRDWSRTKKINYNLTWRSVLHWFTTKYLSSFPFSLTITYLLTKLINCCKMLVKGLSLIKKRCIHCILNYSQARGIQTRCSQRKRIEYTRYKRDQIDLLSSGILILP